MSPLKQKTSVSKVRPRRSRRLAILAVVLLLLAGGAFAYVRTRSNDNPPASTGQINYDPPSQEETKAGEDQKVDRIENQPDTPVAPVERSIRISSAQQDPSSRDVIVITQLKGNGWQRCDLTLTQTGSAEVTASAEVLYQPSYSTCQGFALSPDRFAKSGTWQAVLTATGSDSASQSSEPVSVTVNK